jgi:hypothetical protein
MQREFFGIGGYQKKMIENIGTVLHQNFYLESTAVSSPTCADVASAWTVKRRSREWADLQQGQDGH